MKRMLPRREKVRVSVDVVDILFPKFPHGSYLLDFSNSIKHSFIISGKTY